MKSETKNLLSDYADKLGLRPNGLTKNQALAIIAIIAIENGLERDSAKRLAAMVDDLNALNASAMRQKITRDFFGEAPAKREASDGLDDMLERATG